MIEMGELPDKGVYITNAPRVQDGKSKHKHKRGAECLKKRERERETHTEFLEMKNNSI